MRAIVLAAGLGTRLRPATEVRPKALLPHLNVPLLDRRLRYLVRSGFSEVAVNLQHEGRQIVEHLEEQGGEGLAVRFFWEPEILGTAGALRNARGFLGDEDFLVWNVDAEIEPEIRLLQNAHGSSGAAATLLVVPNPDPRRFTPLFAEGGRLARIGGEGRDPLLFTGVSIHSSRVLSGIEPGFRSLVDEVWRPLLEQGEAIRVALHRGDFSDMGTPADLLAASLRALETREDFEPREGFFDRKNQVLWCEPEPAGALRRCAVGRARISAGARLDACVVWDGAEIGRAELSECLVGPVRLPDGGTFRSVFLWPEAGGGIREIAIHDSHRRSPTVK